MLIITVKYPRLRLYLYTSYMRFTIRNFSQQYHDRNLLRGHNIITNLTISAILPIGNRCISVAFFLAFVTFFQLTTTRVVFRARWKHVRLTSLEPVLEFSEGKADIIFY